MTMAFLRKARDLARDAIGPAEQPQTRTADAGPPERDVVVVDDLPVAGVPVQTGPVDHPTAAPVIGRVLPTARSSPLPGHVTRVPDVAADGLVVGEYSLAAVSLIGSSHAGKGISRQDAYAFGLDPRGRLCVAVADGLGSRPSSQLGARAFCEEVIRRAGSYQDDQPVDPAELITSAAAWAAEVVEQVYGISGRDAACVGAVGVFDGSRHAIARVGDCTAFTFGDDGFAEVFPVDAAFVNQVEVALLDRPVGDVDMAELSASAPLVLCSDGLAIDLRNSPTLRAWLAERWRHPMTAFALLESLRYRRQGSGDDRTAAVIWPGRACPGQS